MRIGIHYNYWNGSGDETQPMQVLEQAAGCGAAAMDFPTAVALTMTAAQRRDLAARAKALDVTLSLNGGIAGAEISHTDAQIRARDLAACKRAIEAAADLQCTVWSGVIYAPWLGLPDSPWTPERREAMWQRALQSVGELCRFAAPLGIDVCIELVNRFEAYLLNTAADGVRFAQETGCDNCKMLLDAFHMNIEEDNPLEAIAQTAAAGRLGHLHISESNRRLPGLRPTHMNWAGFLKAVSQAGYTGAVIVESMVRSTAPASHGFRIWRDLADDMGPQALREDCAKSLRYLNRLPR